MPLIDFKAIEKGEAQFDIKSKFSESKSNLVNINLLLIYLLF